ncbi:MAG: hypothetical protein JST16_03835 [Bdellovibrionales bacterium]|nr:hypothetical protein [Bdellovibrionales bacterium]
MSAAPDKIGTAIADAVAKLLSVFGKLLRAGLPRVPLKSPWFYLNAISAGFLVYVFAQNQICIGVGRFSVPDLVCMWTYQAIYAIPPWIRWPSIGICCLSAYVSTLGIGVVRLRAKYQRGLDCLAFKNGLGFGPSLRSVIEEGSHTLRLTILSEGIGTDRYETRRADLESAFGAGIESIRASNNPRFVEIRLARRAIPKRCKYADLSKELKELKELNSFVVGESVSGTLTQCIRDLPHLLIAGTTGGGKSVFFKQTLMGLLQSSPRLQLYLLDLKGGVEMKEFSALPNVEVAKNEIEAVQVLRAVEAEMNRRFAYMEKKGIKKIDCERDKLDLIVVGVDEASVLYTKVNKKSPHGPLIEEARNLTDSISKLARAAGIHLILATQKVSKETVDTKIQENIGGRACFRMNTLQGSLQVLGNKMAYELPNNPGRAIWSTGHLFVEVQAPLVTDEEIVSTCVNINKEFVEGDRENFQLMLGRPVLQTDTVSFASVAN